ncbi:MAG TPA: hypothetical protein PLA68_12080 [Panacibacter sp.]|nr:hypothetical protein [Panacibacter sp.]
MTIKYAPTISHDEETIKTYEDNYTANGGSVVFGILGAASLLAFAILL